MEKKIVLKAQELGLNSCWVAMTHGKSAAKINKGEKIAILISLGYGKNQGVEHKSKIKFTLNGDQVKAIATGGFYSQIDLGIVKYHFEAVTGRKVN